MLLLALYCTYCAPTPVLNSTHSSQVMLWGRQRAERLPCLLRCYWVQQGCCVEIWGNKYKSATGRKYKWCTRRNPSLQWLIVVHCTCSKWPLCCCNTVGNMPIWGEKYKRGSFRKYKWCTRRNPSLHWLPEKWRNWGKGVRGPQWADETCQIGSKWQNLMFIHDWFQFRWAFWCRIFFWLRTRPPKLKYCFFGGSFSQPTSKSKWVREPD